MPLGKLIYILLSVWLINALVCFQGNNVFEDGVQQSIKSLGPRHIPNTLVRLIRTAGREVEDDADSGIKKIKYNLRYLNRLRHVASIYWVAVQRSNRTNYLVAKLLKVRGRRSSKLAWLPSPDLFIFRLTPF